MFQDIIGSGVLFRNSVPEHLARSWAIGAVPNPLRRFEKNQIQFNQNAYDKSGCTYTAGMTIVSNNRIVYITPDDIQWFLANKHLYGRTWAGMYLDRACDMVCDRLNMLNPQQGRAKKQIDYYTERSKYLALGHMIMIWSMINDTYIEEIKDWSIKKARWKTWIWHVRCDILSLATSNEAIVENFLGVLPFNVINIDNIKDLEDNTQLYHTAFLIYPTWKMETPIKYPYMTVEEAEALEKSYPMLVSPSFSESVRAWVDLAKAGEDIYYEFVNFTGLDGVMKMMINLDKYRSNHLSTE